eukprot:9680394-Lingulodinium_polyedra.AAC.1
MVALISEVPRRVAATFCPRGVAAAAFWESTSRCALLPFPPIIALLPLFLPPPASCRSSPDICIPFPVSRRPFSAACLPPLASRRRFAVAILSPPFF